VFIGSESPWTAGTAAGSLGVAEQFFTLYARLLAPVLAGYLLLDRTFAYIHVPGTPLFIGEIVLGIGIVAALLSIGDLRVPSKDSEKVFIALGLLCVWGSILAVAGVATYGLDAARDSALWYYSLFAFLTYAALIRSPAILDRWISQFGKFIPWLLIWLPSALIVAPAVEHLSAISATAGDGKGLLLNTKTGDSAIAALLGLGYLWFFPERFGARARTAWSMMALLVIALAGTQNRGGLIAAGAGAMVGLAFHPDRGSLVKRYLAVVTIGLALACLMPDMAYPGLHLRHYTATQLLQNVWSLVDSGSGTSNLDSTTKFRTELWSRVLTKQVTDGHIVDGEGFGPNLAADVGVYAGMSDSFRSPHNSHLDILARMGLIGLSFWIAIWVGWYWRMIAGCRRLAERGLYARRHVAVLCLMVATAIMVSSYFDPQLEGPQIAIPLWSFVGLGIAVTSARLGPIDSDTHSSPVQVRS
jgi:hypothetical protein